MSKKICLVWANRVPVENLLTKLEKHSPTLCSSHPHYSRREWTSPSLNKSLRVQKDPFSLQPCLLILWENIHRNVWEENLFTTQLTFSYQVSLQQTQFSLHFWGSSTYPSLLVATASLTPPLYILSLPFSGWVILSAESHLSSLTSNSSRQPLNSSNSTQVRWRRGHVGSYW